MKDDPVVREKARANAKRWRAAHPNHQRDKIMANPEYRAAIVRKSRLGIQPHEFDALWSNQDGCCAICSIELTRIGMHGAHVDHDHATGRIRGLLCKRCNTALGMMRDSPDLLRRSIQYLEQHAAQA